MVQFVNPFFFLGVSAQNHENLLHGWSKKCYLHGFQSQIKVYWFLCWCGIKYRSRLGDGCTTTFVRVWHCLKHQDFVITEISGLGRLSPAVLIFTLLYQTDSWKDTGGSSHSRMSSRITKRPARILDRDCRKPAYAYFERMEFIICSFLGISPTPEFQVLWEVNLFIFQFGDS